MSPLFDPTFQEENVIQTERSISWANERLIRLTFEVETGCWTEWAVKMMICLSFR